MSAEKKKKLSHYAAKRAGQTKPQSPGVVRPLIDSLRISLGMCACGRFEGDLCSNCRRVLEVLNPPRLVRA